MNHQNYRPEIDGLRAIAVLSVVIAHANAQWLPNGHLGVDVFFVISGFLITQILYQEMNQGTFSFIEFYKRRAKRLLPALLFILTITTILTFFIFNKDDFVAYISSLFYSLIFVTNIHFAKKGTDYFGSFAQEQPLLHLWSLSIEEQFYFIFPIILLLSIKYFKNKLIWIILGCIGLSLASKFVPFFNWKQYYLPQIRAYELLIGSLFALLPKKSIPIHLQWGALITIIFMMFIPKEWGFLGKSYVERLIICFSTALLLWNYQIVQYQYSPNKILSSRIFIFFGLISYSLYLWHWVIFALLKYIYMQNDYKENNIPIFILISSILISIFLAYITYKFIENPIRKLKYIKNRDFIFFIFTYFIIAFSILVFRNDYKDRKNDTIPQSILWEKEICHSKLPSKNLSCLKGDLTLNKPTILVVGDSHAGQYNQFFNYIGQKEHWLSSVISSSGCSFLYQQKRYGENKSAIDCNTYRDFINQQLKNYDTIILLGRWESNVHNNRDGDFLLQLEKTLQYLLQHNKKIYVFADNPTISLQGTRSYHLNQKGLLFTTPKISPKTAEANKIIEKIVKKYPQIVWVDVNPYIPKSFMIDNIPLYTDDDHFNPYGARKIAERFSEKEILIQSENDKN